MIQKGKHQYGNIWSPKTKTSGGSRESQVSWVSHQSHWCPQVWWTLVCQHYCGCNPRKLGGQPTPLVPAPPAKILDSHESVSLRTCQNTATLAINNCFIFYISCLNSSCLTKDARANQPKREVVILEVIEHRTGKLESSEEPPFKLPEPHPRPHIWPILLPLCVVFPVYAQAFHTGVREKKN